MVRELLRAYDGVPDIRFGAHRVADRALAVLLPGWIAVTAR